MSAASRKPARLGNVLRLNEQNPGSNALLVAQRPSCISSPPKNVHSAMVHAVCHGPDEGFQPVLPAQSRFRRCSDHNWTDSFIQRTVPGDGERKAQMCTPETRSGGILGRAGQPFEAPRVRSATNWRCKTKGMRGCGSGCGVASTNVPFVLDDPHQRHIGGARGCSAAPR